MSITSAVGLEFRSGEANSRPPGSPAMTTTRTPISRSKNVRITPEVIAAYRYALKLRNNPKIDEWEADGGCHREYLEARYELGRLLGRVSADEQILDTIGQDDPEDVPTRICAPWNVESWKEAIAIRHELERLCRG